MAGKGLMIDREDTHCGTKRQYGSKKAALRAIKTAGKALRDDVKGRAVTYKCRDCPWWHIGHEGVK